MEEKLDFYLPEKKDKNSIVPHVLVVLLVILLVLASMNLVLMLSRRKAVSGVPFWSLSAEQTKHLANKLAQRSLNMQAAKVWQDYLSREILPNGERAKVLFQIGTLFEKANLYADAIEYYYRSEIAAKLDEFEPQINTHIKDCFEKLGKFSALKYELMDRTSFKQPGQAGSKVVAEIGSEKITEADLEAIIENNIDVQLKPMAAFMTTEQLDSQKKEMLEKYKSPQAKLQYLQNWVAEEILYRQALQEQLADKTEVKGILEDIERDILSQQLMNQQLAAKIHITDTDLQTYYAANKEKYVEPAKAKIGHIVVDDEQQAKELVSRIKNNEDFAKLAKEFSKDESTKESGGKIDTEVTRGSYVPGIGDANELNQRIFEANAPALLEKPVNAEKGWEIVRVESKTTERQKSFAEVKQQVMMTLLNKKRQDVQQDYIKEMMDKYNVIIHAAALTSEDKGESNEKINKPAK